MIMEIGGYFGLEDYPNNEFYPNLIALNLARNALAYLIKTKSIKKLYIPAFICNSIYDICVREECEFEFYEIDKCFQPIFNKQLKEAEWLYVVNYYGQVTNVKLLREKYGHIILDNVQAFFQKPIEGIDTIYSCRKYFGVPDGAYLSTKAIASLPLDYSYDRMTHLLGRYEKTGSEFYDAFCDNEERLNNLELRQMSKLTHNLLGVINYAFVQEKREENFSFLADQLNVINRLSVVQPIGPFAYPLYLDNGQEIRKSLNEDGIYIPVLWPDMIADSEIAKELSENILPLPVDQRYSLDNMEFIVDSLKKHLR